MEEITILNTNFCKIKYEKNIDLLTTKWLRHPSNKEHREAFFMGLEAIKKYHISKFITDMRKIGIVSKENRIWLEKELIPEAVKYGIRYVATILDHDTFKRYYLEQIKITSKKIGIQFKIFDDNIQEALEWILYQEAYEKV